MATINGVKYTKNDLIKRMGDISQIGGATEKTLTAGKAKDTKIIDIRNGAGLNYTIIPDRGMDIGFSEFKGVALSYISQTGITAPQFYNGQDFRGSFYAGLLTTCGLTQMGSACVDCGEDLPTHGRISNMPAYDVGVTQEWEGDDFVIKARGKVKEAKFFGENIVMTREIKTVLGENKIYIDDVIENCGFTPQPFMLLYHFNFGFPLMSKDAEIRSNCTDLTPRDDQANKGIGEAHKLEDPINSYKEQVFYRKAPKEAYGEIYNSRLNMGVRVNFKGDELEKLIQWKQMGEGAYALGLEPATWYPEGREQARKRGELKFIEPGEIKKISIVLEII